jgi:hypothetical protein
MANWTFDANQYEEKDFAIIPAGDHRVRIMEVTEKTFNSGNEGYEITFEVSGYNSKLWFYLVLDQNDPKKTNQRIGDFFNSFGVTGSNLGNGKQWIGKVGAVRVKHEEYNGNMSAKVAYCINRKNQDKLPPAKFSSSAASASVQPVAVNQDDLPF